MYKCTNCRKALPALEEKIRCPYCGYRIFLKQRADVVNKVQAR